MPNGADSALDMIFKESSENPPVLNPQPVQASIPKRYPMPPSLMGGFGETEQLEPTGTLPSARIPEEQKTTLGGQFAQAGKNILGAIGDIFQKLDNPTSLLYGAFELSIKKMRGEEFTPKEEKFIQKYLGEVTVPMAEAFTNPSNFFPKWGESAKGIFTPSEELQQSYEETFGTKSKIAHSLGNPLWYALPGAAGLKAGRLAQVAAKGGVKGVLAKTGQVALTPAADIETALAKVATLPFKGTARLVNSLRRHGDTALTQQADDILRRAQAGESIAPEEIQVVVQKSGKVGQDLTEALRNIKLEQVIDDVPNYAQPLWSKLSPARRRAIVKAAGLGEEISQKSWKIMSDVEKKAINRLYYSPETHPTVQKVTQILDDAKISQAEQRFQRAGVREQRGAILSKELKKATTPEEVATAQTKALTGEMPKVSLETKVTPEDGAELFNIIQNSPALQYRPFDKMRLLTAPSKSAPEGGALWKLQNGILPQDNEIRLLEEVFGTRFATSLRNMKGLDNKVVSNLLELTNLPRALVSSVDLSNTLRQSVILAFAEPELAAKSFIGQVKSFGSQKAFDDVIARIRAHPLYGKVRENGLIETHLTTEGPRGLREEPFMSRWANKIPLIKQSARAFTAMSNQIRFEAAYKYMSTKPQFWSDDETRWLMRLLNWETGRGPVPQSWLPALSSIFFSPALQTARIAMPVTLFKASPAVRRMAWRHFIQFTGANLGILTAAQASGAIDLEMNPTSTDFGKIRVGNTRLDTWGGFLPYWRLMTRMLTGEYKSQMGEIREVDREEEAIRAVLMKFAPFPGFIMDMIRGETIVGDELTLAPEDVRDQVIQRLAPFVVQDIMEAAQEDGWMGGMTAASSIVGVGAVSYPSRTFSTWLESIESYTGEDWDLERIQAIRPLYDESESKWEEYLNIKGDKAKRYYRRENPEIDASLYFWGETSKMEAQDESMPLVQKMLDDYGLTWDVLPIRVPTEPFERDGWSDEQVKQHLTTFLPSDIANYFLENEGVLDDRDLDEYVNQVQQVRAEDKRMVDLYELLTYDPDPTVKQRNRDKYLRENPEVDAARVLWNGSIKTLHSTEARRILLEKLDVLGIPPEAIDLSSGAVSISKGKTTPTGGSSLIDRLKGY